MYKNSVGKGENAVYQHFSPFPAMFLKALFIAVDKTRDSMVNGLKFSKVLICILSRKKKIFPVHVM